MNRKIMLPKYDPLVRASYGGMSINRKDYRDGQFLPGRRVYAQIREQPDTGIPSDLDHDHLKTLDLHRVEPSWNKQGSRGRNAYGGVIFNPQGQVLLVEPTNHFLGYHWTFPKGGIDPGEHPVDTGRREVKEETGHDTSILGLVPNRFPGPSGTSHSQYFLMRSHGQTGLPSWETQTVRWAAPDEAHQLINQSTTPDGKRRDHAVLDAALAQLKLLKSQPEMNNHLRPVAQRVNYSRASCDHTCGCTRCAASTALTRVVYSRRVRRISYESTDSGRGHYGDWTPRWRDQVSPAEFIAARNNTKYPGFLSPLSEDEIKNHKLILSHDHTIGAALSPEGDIQNVFNNNGPKGAGMEAILELMRQGGHTLDAFDHFLPGLYSQFGFKETGRVKFNRDYAPSGWNYQTHGEPDVVFMARPPHEPIHEDEIRRRVLDHPSWHAHVSTHRYFDDWDQAKAHSRGGGVPDRDDPGARPEVGGGELGGAHRERASGGLPLNVAAQGHASSLNPQSPLGGVARAATDATAPPGPVQQAYQETLQRVRSKSSPRPEIK